VVKALGLEGSEAGRSGASRMFSVVLVGLLALTLVLFGGLQFASYGSSRRQVTQAVAEARARDPRRPLLRGEGVPGSAWTEYERALAAVKGAKIDELRRWLEGAAAADRSKAEAILAANKEALDFLRAGARKAEGAYPLQWERGVNADIPSLVTVRDLTTLAVGRARVLVETGKPREAADVLLDAAQLGADLGRNPIVITELIALSSLGQVFDALKALPPDAEVGRALAVLDRTFPDHAQALTNDITLMGVTFTAPGTGGPDLSAWRYGFSSKLMLADAWTTLQTTVRRMVATTTESWSDAQRLTAGIEAEARRSSNPIVGMVMVGLSRSDRTSREGRAQLRLLRVHHGGTGGLDDPFGGKLLSDGVRVWSVGADGVDGGGAGDWKPASTGDIVLKLPAR
jgi:hypothetical protein